MSLNLKQFGLIAITGVLLVVMGMYGILMLSQRSAIRVEHHAEEQNTEILEAVIPLIKLSKDIRFDVVQVQQWLTDISATQGRDGLDDGLDVAQSYAIKFQKDTDAAIKIAQSLDLKKAIKTFEEIQRAFPPYYSAGRKMAEAYVANGPAGGNPMMSDFDAAADEITNFLQANEAEIEKLSEHIRQDRAEIVAEAKSQRSFSTLSSTIMLLIALSVVGLIGLVGLRAIVAIISLSETMDIVKKGRITKRILNIKRIDEIGIMQHAFNDLMDLTEFFVRDAGACLKAFSNGMFERKILPDGLTGRFREVAQEINNGVEAMGHKNEEFVAAGGTFETGVKGNFDTIKNSMSSLQQASESLLGLADDSNREAEVVAEATSTSVSGVQAVATATEELSASIQEIGRQVSNSAELVSESALEAENAAGQIKELSEASVKIGDVVEIITGIAEQTNLLALNATIESARAGEAGKGFAVVAQEVKALAAQTGSATEEVRTQVDTIQSQTSNAVQVIEAVSNRMAQVNEAVTAIAAAVEEQGAATNEISSSIDTVSTETNRMSEAVTLLQAAIVKTRESANEMNSSTGVVNDVSGTVATDIDSFMDTMKAATG
jgi:methyl-accepting chemotaxis protein